MKKRVEIDRLRAEVARERSRAEMAEKLLHVAAIHLSFYRPTCPERLAKVTVFKRLVNAFFAEAKESEPRAKLAEVAR